MFVEPLNDLFVIKTSWELIIKVLPISSGESNSISEVISNNTSLYLTASPDIWTSIVCGLLAVKLIE
ncbi:hypothetical protein [Mycoplasmopsis felis]|uniref:hypothetical protein n=1 Tax=Mycoplasmopsis felis TaxID=33923 RepID=UPI002AFEAD6D|nr:hypothetical protein [Mycoplasmopsis felis]WQQ08744.1 hypothetical protein RRG61_01345 [Mycoplasmopsis felis]